MTNLKEEWKEILKKVEQRNIYPSGGGYFTVMTDFYKAPDEIRYDKEMCLQVLLDANECIWNIPIELRTNEFLEEIIEKGYKGNILRAKKIWEEEDFPFIKKYLARFEEKDKPKFDQWMSEPKGIFANKEMLISLIREDNYNNTEYLLKYYKKDKEVLCALLDKHPDNISEMPKSIKNAYCKDKENIYKILNYKNSLFEFLPDKIKSMQEFIEYQLQQKGTALHYLPEDVVKDRERIFELIKKYDNIKGTDVPYVYREDFEIAKYLIAKDGKNFSAFNFMKNDELIRLAAQTNNSISYIPSKDEYADLIKEITLRSDLEENRANYSSEWGNNSKLHYIKDLLHELLKNKQINEKIVATFFNLNVKINNENRTNIIEEKQLLLDIIKDFPVVYEHLEEYKIEGHFDVTHQYIETCKLKGKDYKKAMSFRIKSASSSNGMEIDKYVMGEYLSNKLAVLPKGKLSKI